MQAAVNLLGEDLQEEVVVPPILDRSTDAIEGDGVVDLLSGSRKARLPDHLLRCAGGHGPLLEDPNAKLRGLDTLDQWPRGRRIRYGERGVHPGTDQVSFLQVRRRLPGGPDNRDQGRCGPWLTNLGQAIQDVGIGVDEVLQRPRAKVGSLPKPPYSLHFEVIEVSLGIGDVTGLARGHLRHVLLRKGIVPDRGGPAGSLRMSHADRGWQNKT